MLHTILTFGAILGLLLMIVGMLSARIVLEASGTPESVMGEALLYIRIYFSSLPFMTIYNFGSAILRSYGDSRRPMYYLLASGIVNVILNLFLVICFRLGVSGVAIATVISNVLSAFLVTRHLQKRDDEFQFCFRKMHINKKRTVEGSGNWDSGGNTGSYFLCLQCIYPKWNQFFRRGCNCRFFPGSEFRVFYI